MSASRDLSTTEVHPIITVTLTWLLSAAPEVAPYGWPLTPPTDPTMTTEKWSHEEKPKPRPVPTQPHEQDAEEDSSDAGDFEGAPTNGNPATDQLEPEPGQSRFERWDTSDQVASPYTAVEQASRGRSDSFTVELPGDLVALIFEKAGQARPLDLDQDILLDALGRALS
jgi:ParB family chromosome partitioning protein